VNVSQLNLRSEKFDDDDDDNNNNNKNNGLYAFARKETGVKSDNEHWYDHLPKALETNCEGTVTILWN
jgi:hypothetical protein